MTTVKPYFELSEKLTRKTVGFDKLDNAISHRFATGTNSLEIPFLPTLSHLKTVHRGGEARQLVGLDCHSPFLGLIGFDFPLAGVTIDGEIDHR
jgi:hypothetical protein